MGLKEIVPQSELYHGTAERFLDSILEEGLTPRGRLYVHLSDNVITAKSVGQRHGKVVILSIDTKKLVEDGFKFYISKNKVYLTEKVLPKYLSLMNIEI
ncbi:MAG: RNA 2'-phosphotransferase [Sarcina sp.]